MHDKIPAKEDRKKDKLVGERLENEMNTKCKWIELD